MTPTTIITTEHVHLEHDLINGIITIDDFVASFDYCGTSNLRTTQNNSSSQNLLPSENKLSTQSLFLEASISIKPNPATNKIFIYNSTEKNVAYQLKDVYGKIISGGIISTGGIIDCAKYPRGIYTIQFSTLDGAKTVNERIVLN